jgi:AraC-like DNA-binding protein
MNVTSSWPLPHDGIRFVSPVFISAQLAASPLSRTLYPLAVGYYPNALGHHMQRQTQESYLMIYCVAGKGTLTTDNKHHSISAGDCFCLSKDSPHSYQADSKDPWTIYWLHFEGEAAKAFYESVHWFNPILHIGIQARVVRVFDALSALRHSGYQLDEFIQGSHQLQALISYLALLSRGQDRQSGKALDWEHLRANMQEHVHGSLNLDSLAAEAQMSKYHFSKKFKKMTGHSPIQYFINMKMQRACYLLDSTRRSVKQVGTEMGYEDPYYFSRLFKKVIGLSPQQYRRSPHHR